MFINALVLFAKYVNDRTFASPVAKRMNIVRGFTFPWRVNFSTAIRQKTCKAVCLKRTTARILSFEQNISLTTTLINKVLEDRNTHFTYIR